MERKRTADINLVKESHRAEREKLEEEIDYLTQQVENLKARNSESFILAENSRSTAEKLARTEEGLAEEKIPVQGSEAAVRRIKQLEKQFPLHDVEPDMCHQLSQGEIDK